MGEKERKEKNRKSAAKSRQRKKEAWESMHKRCKELERINVALAHQLALASQELARVNRLASCDASGRGTGTKQPQPEVESFPLILIQPQTSGKVPIPRISKTS